MLDNEWCNITVLGLQKEKKLGWAAANVAQVEIILSDMCRSQKYAVRGKYFIAVHNSSVMGFSLVWALGIICLLLSERQV